MQLLEKDNPILHTKSQPVQLTPGVLEWIEEFIRFRQSSFPTTKMQMVGLAAVQVGQPWRIFIAKNKLFINPEIIWLPNPEKNGWFAQKEMCFSCEWGKEFPVKRAYAVELRWQDRQGGWHEQRFNDSGEKPTLAQVIQHEMDHLEGKLITDGHEKL